MEGRFHLCTALHGPCENAGEIRSLSDASNFIKMRTIVSTTISPSEVPLNAAQPLGPKPPTFWSNLPSETAPYEFMLLEMFL